MKLWALVEVDEPAVVETAKVPAVGAEEHLTCQGQSPCINFAPWSSGMWLSLTDQAE